MTRVLLSIVEMQQLADAICALNDEGREGFTDEQVAVLRKNSKAVRAAVLSTIQAMRLEALR